MRSLLIFVALGWTLRHVDAQTPKPTPPGKASLQTQEHVEFDGHKLVLAFEDKNEALFLKEYIPEGETLEKWTKLAAFFEYPQQNEPSVISDAIVSRLKEKDASVEKRLHVLHHKQTDDVILDFITFPDDFSFAEFNVFRFSKRPGGGVIAHQFAMRAYGEESTPFVKGLKKVRERLVLLMATKGLHFVKPTPPSESQKRQRPE